MLLSFALGSIKIVLFGRDLISSLNTVQLLALSITGEEFPACAAGGAMALGTTLYPSLGGTHWLHCTLGSLFDKSSGGKTKAAAVSFAFMPEDEVGEKRGWSNRCYEAALLSARFIQSEERAWCGADLCKAPRGAPSKGGCDPTVRGVGSVSR